jgi:GT2 family glycosyltransferase
MSPSLATIIVTHNCADTMTECLRSLEESTVPSTLFVVDNASSDGTVPMVRSIAPEATMLEQAENFGFAGGCNLGIRAAQSLRPDYLFFLNPDASVDRRCIETLVAAMDANPELAVVSPVILSGLSGDIWYAGAELDLTRGQVDHLGWNQPNLDPAPGVTPTGRPTGCAMLVRRTVVDEVGFMDPSYFLYWEETEWTLRFREAGHHVGFVPRATATHFVSATTGGWGSKIYEYYFLRNRLRLFNEKTGRTRFDLTRSSLRESAWRVKRSLRSQGCRAALGTSRALVLAYVDFWQGRSGRCDRL